ncbi:MAG: tyrosine-type recombinase/integrase, partial [gamma proteobacterium symbiont of Bathyaustriella thionipta]|nr:tyrosine-type recombinase/integrase [gamma proteobacterium symbiont of Bathyaustriella thionipta]MCU7949379.1 tyrosine-type recombinase/integrase [gamma proteobacterium symbiont of Bathyaustriella thionipta]MCU7952515.1 tyrosine-type recombinase/integrase [gamma proteobacterium symbiont of Bathyaustriella thionipta]MCU7955977.1 tyrosine-type recombinase/integrase [gamma proteobacterium symbiont of Bathyaustriella thionipta]MCU7967054.1 tyrosine-type recombinase/integrase [gamma proteobacteri
MKLTDSKIKALKSKDKPYQSPDGNGLVIEVKSTGKKVWIMRFRFEGKSQKVILGEYPYFSLVKARQWREECRSKVARGINPAEEKKAEKDKAKQESKNTVKSFSEFWMTEHVEKVNRTPRNIRRVFDKDVIPAIGKMKLQDVEPGHIHEIIDSIKKRGSDTAALITRNVIKRMYAYAITRGVVTFNPAAAIEAKYIAQAKSRDVALTPEEIGKLLRGIYTSNINRSNKLALHLLILTMVRKSELIEASWEEVDFKKAQWSIPAERMKKDKPHIVYLSQQALAMFEELKNLAGKSEWVLPSPHSWKKPISKTTLNSAIRTLDLEIKDFVIHDFRRTASTHLHEMGFNSDWIEKCLSHEQQGVRGVYNRAEYAEQRKNMLQQLYRSALSSSACFDLFYPKQATSFHPLTGII